MAKWTIRQTTASDRAAVDRLLSSSKHKHLHLDWLDVAELTSKQPFLLAVERNRTVACLAAPPDSPGVAWLRAFAVESAQLVQRAWDRLWPLAEQELVEQRIETVAAMALDEWLAKLLRAAGFIQTNLVIFLELDLEREPPAHAPGRTSSTGPAQSTPGSRADAGLPVTGRGRRSRPITAVDLPRVLELDAAAFHPLWRLSAEPMRAALGQASSATLLEIDASVVGYQITTSSPFSVHLARLAVHPKWHRQGLGRALAQDSIRTAAALPLGRLSVNTQADNAASLALYQRLGFKQTGQQFPVYTADLARQ